MWSAIVLSVCCSILPPAVAAESGGDAGQLFTQRVLPLLKEKCFACHGDDPKKMKASLDLRTRATMLKGGESRQPTLVPGEPEKSRLYVAVTRRDPDLAMPPKENDRLNAEQIGWIRQWIAAGAPWPDGAGKTQSAKWDADYGLPVKTSGGLSADWTNRKYKPENLWAYQPLKKRAVPSIQNPIDALIAAKLPAGLQTAPLADRRTLLRRATLDLTGLPPTSEEIADFLTDREPDDRAFAKVVERLLASPHYGEQWARHWLVVARYADSSGFANDYARGNAWRYRDYVVRAFNDDMPYDRFVREQLAGDEMDASNPETLVATGFLRMGPWELTAMEVAKVARQRFLDDVTQSVGETFLAHAVQCARCHDHKFDPLPTRDYYSLQAVFATTQLAERPAAFLPRENTAGFDEEKYFEQRRRHYLGILARLDEKSIAAARAWYAEKKLDAAGFEAALEEARKRPVARRGGEPGGYEAARQMLMKRGIAEDQVPPRHAGFAPADFGMERIARKGLERLAWETDRYKPVAFSVYSGRSPEVKSVVAPMRMPANRMTAGELEESCILSGGDPFSPKDKVAPAVLSAVEAFVADAAAPVPQSITGRRLALADWIASPRNPLTARVMVNRIWQWHFGQAIAGNPSNFGATGKKPTHPELLDWLAATFIEQGWSVKAMHRLIMNSETYRRGSQHPDPKTLAEKDPNGTSYAVFKPRRLAAEELRDAMLRASGELNLALGGIPVRPEMNLEAAFQPRQVMGTFAEAWQPSPKPEQRHRRSIYAMRLRGLRDPFMEVFNDPTPDLSCEARDTSTVTPQVFAMFNSQSSYARALAFAARLMKETGNRPAAIMRAFQLAFSREPAAEELSACLAHWDAMTARHRGLKFDPPPRPREVARDALEENTGERFAFVEPLEASDDFVPDLQPADATPETRGLAEVCLVLLNSNEFTYVY
ncbi:MAG: PSD1 domain-containing protein [Verrucomicrobia bacterium]|nr:PSD1 domain-containing protein [Verrucomicrobiota bacterium]